MSTIKVKLGSLKKMINEVVTAMPPATPNTGSKMTAAKLIEILRTAAPDTVVFLEDGEGYLEPLHISAVRVDSFSYDDEDDDDADAYDSDGNPLGGPAIIISSSDY